MTETEVEIVWDSACKDYVPNKTLGKVLHENMMHFMPLEITPEEEQYEKALSDTAGEASKKALYGRAKMLFPQYDDAKHREMAAAGLLKEPVPAEAKLKIGGSTDVGDVSWVAPTAMITVACEPQGTPPHSWQWVANGKSSAAHKGMLVAGKSIAMTAYDLLTRPELLEAAAAEQVQNLNGENYHSIIRTARCLAEAARPVRLVKGGNNYDVQPDHEQQAAVHLSHRCHRLRSGLFRSDPDSLLEAWAGDRPEQGKTERCYHFFGDLFHPAVHFHHHWSVFSDGRSGCALVLVPPVGGRLRNVRVDGSRYGGDRQRLRIHWCPKRFR